MYRLTEDLGWIDEWMLNTLATHMKQLSNERVDQEDKNIIT